MTKNNESSQGLNEKEFARLEMELERRFAHLFQDPQNKDWSAEKFKQNRRARGLVAYSLVHLLKLEDESAAKAVIDGDEDNGIDAIFYRRKVLYIVQGKLKLKDPDQKETTLFIRGVENLLSHRFENFNFNDSEKVLEKIGKYLMIPGIKIKLIYIFTGKEIKGHALRPLVEFCEERRNNSQFILLNGYTVYQSMVNSQNRVKIDENVSIKHYAYDSKSRPKIIMGRISIDQLAKLYRDYGESIFHKNIRNFLGNTQVNKNIERTLLKNPSLMIAYSNGITVMCDSFELPTGVSDNFRLFNLSIVNGAQTVGSIASIIAKGNSIDAMVPITVISSENMSKDFIRSTTRARNTQNVMPSSAFAALSDIHEEKAKIFKLIGVQYIYKPGVKYKSESINITIDIKDIARSMIIMYGRDRGDIYYTQDLNNILKPRGENHDFFINDRLRKTSEETILKAILIFRQIDKFFDDNKESLTSTDINIFNNMKNIIYILVFNEVWPKIRDNNHRGLDTDDLKKISVATDKYSDAVQLSVKKYWEIDQIDIRVMGKSPSLLKAMMVESNKLISESEKSKLADLIVK